MGVVPIIPEDIKATKAYETIRFDTSDGDLALGQYAVDNDGATFYIREVEKSEGHFTATTTKPKGKELVNIVCEKCQYYAEYPTSRGTIERGKYSDAYKQNPLPTKKEFHTLLEPSVAEAAPNYGAVATTTYNSVSSASFSFSTAGSERGLVGSVMMHDSSDTDRNVTVFSYDSTTLIEGTRQDDTTNNITVEMWYLVNPTAGSNTVQINTNGTVTTGLIKMDYVTEASQTAFFDATTGNADDNSTFVSYSLTTVADNTLALSSNTLDSGSSVACSPIGVTKGTNFVLSAGHDDPEGIATTTGFYWIVDDVDDEVYKYNDDGTYASVSFDTAASGNTSPKDITFATSTFYIVNDSADEVFQYSTTGTYLGSFDTAGAGSASPSGIVFIGGLFYISDTTTVWVFNGSGTLVTSYDVSGSGFTTSDSITFANDKFYISSDSTNEVYEFDSSFVFTRGGFQVGELAANPIGITYYDTDFILLNDALDTATYLYSTGLTMNVNDGINGTSAKGCSGYTNYTTAGVKNVHWVCNGTGCGTTRDWVSAAISLKASTSTAPAGTGFEWGQVI